MAIQVEQEVKLQVGFALFSAKQWESSKTYTWVGNPTETGALWQRCTLARGHSGVEAHCVSSFPRESKVGIDHAVSMHVCSVASDCL